MLSQKNRLKKKKDFNLTFKKGKTFKNELIKVKVKKNKKKEKKVGFVAPIKKFKKATDRNRIKRLLREAFKEFLNDIPEGIYIIFIARSKIKDKDLVVIKKKMKDILIKSNLIE
jgi:ribonuclease P protein component